MNSTETSFLRSAREWICEGYSLDVRYLERLDLGAPQLWEAWVGLTPVRPAKDMSFSIATSQIAAGQLQTVAMPAKEIVAQLQDAVCGRIIIDSRVVSLVDVQSFSYYSEPMHPQRWYGPLELQIIGNRSSQSPAANLNLIDTELRRASLPFDGIGDLCAWLGFSDSRLTGSGPQIKIQIQPPIDLIVEKCKLREDRLDLELVAMESFDTASVGVAIRGFPGDGLLARQQVASRIRWSRARRGISRGRVTMKAKKMDSVLVMVTVGVATVRRQWFVDPARARNHRMTAVQLFDKDLRMLRQAIGQTADASRFELAVETLLFLLGFAPTVMIERDAPDIIVATPGGRLVLVECTTRIADFHAKAGKLIDRRGALIKAMQTSGHGTTVLSVLVCALPRDQIAVSDAELAVNSILLVSAEVLAAALDQTRVPVEPDKLLDDGFASVSRRATQPTAGAN